MPMAVMVVMAATGIIARVIPITGPTRLITGVITRRRGTGIISRSGRIDRTIGNHTTTPTIAGAHTEPAR